MVLTKKWSVVFAAAFTALLMFFSAIPAQAHDELLETNPAPDAQLDSAPENITFSFSNDLIALGNIVHILDAEGKEWMAGDPIVKRHQMTQQLTPGAPDGWYVVNWRAVSSDGHPITGTQMFLVGDNPDLPKPGNGETADNDTADTATDTADNQADVQETNNNEFNQWMVRIVLIVAVIGVGMTIFLLLKRRRRQ